MGIFDDFEVDEGVLAGLPRTSELGALDFANETESIRAIIRMARAAARQDTRELPRDLLREAPQQLSIMRDAITAMERFSVVGQQDPSGVHEGIARRVDDVRDWFASKVRPQIQSDVDAVEARAELEQILEKARADEEAVARIRGALQERAGRKGASDLSGNYSARVTHHRRAAKRFFGAAAVLVGVTVGVAIPLFVSLHVSLNLHGGTQWAQFVRDLVIRLFFLGLLSYALAFCVRNYRVNKHLEVVNQQKANALDTYPLLTEATSSDTARDLITAELVRTVFEPGDTGYLGDDQERTVIDSQASLLGAILNRPG